MSNPHISDWGPSPREADTRDFSDSYAIAMALATGWAKVTPRQGTFCVARCTNHSDGVVLSGTQVQGPETLLFV